MELDRLYAAGRRAIRDQLLQDRSVEPSAIEDLLSTWEREAERRHIDPDDASFWDHAAEWIVEERGRQSPRGSGPSGAS